MDREIAIKWTGGLSNTTKMPGASLGLPASACKTGAKLRKIPGSVCSKCYGCKGYYPRPTVKNAQERRLQALQNRSKWVWGMQYLISKQKCKYFRFHDTGDIQSLKHLIMIAQVCILTPDVKHRLPTKEVGIVKQYLKKYRFPDNLVVRVSSNMIGQPPRTDIPELNTSTVNTDIGFKCPATRSRSSCGECRVCWNPKIKNIDYKLH